jgi:hypothetical protein
MPPCSPGGKRRAHQRLLAGFVGKGAEPEAGRVLFQVDRPAGEDAGEARDVGLCIAGSGRDSVQLQALAGEILVEPAMGA